MTLVCCKTSTAWWYELFHVNLFDHTPMIAFLSWGIRSTNMYLHISRTAQWQALHQPWGLCRHFSYYFVAPWCHLISSGTNHIFPSYCYRCLHWTPSVTRVINYWVTVGAPVPFWEMIASLNQEGQFDPWTSHYLGFHWDGHIPKLTWFSGILVEINKESIQLIRSRHRGHTNQELRSCSFSRQI